MIRWPASKSAPDEIAPTISIPLSSASFNTIRQKQAWTDWQITAIVSAPAHSSIAELKPLSNDPHLIRS